MRLLIVEDEKNIANNLKVGFMDEGFNVSVAYDGNDGYQLASDETFDVIILDIMLPGMDGIKICQNLRAEKNYTPIIMLTARDSIENRVLGLETGADDYLVKPFSFSELLARVRSLIRRATSKEPVITVDNLQVDPNKHTVKRAGRDIELTAKEYYLLEYLVSHPNQVLTRDQIIDHVWDYNYDGFSNPVDVFMLRLRKKLEDNFPKEKKLIHTIRGLGYKFGVKSVR